MKTLHTKPKDSSNAITRLGIFSASLLLTVSALYLYSPVASTNASEIVDVIVGANPVVSLTLDTNSLKFKLAPKDDADAFASKSVQATVNTNSSRGYELYFSSVDNETDLVSSDQSISDVISSDFDNTVTSATMGSNKWGYSLDNENFSKIPALSDHATLRNLNHLPNTSERITTTNIGIRVDNTISSGVYSKSILFSAIAHDTPVGIHSITSMQEMTSAICAASTIPDASATDIDWDGSHNGDNSYVPRNVLTDTRDGKTYLVSKLADGNCWMSQNLALDLTANSSILASNNDGTVKTVTPNFTTINGTTEDTWYRGHYEDNWRSYRPEEGKSYYQGGTTASSSPSNEGPAYAWEKAGNLYNWYAATAGTGTHTHTMIEAESSICPKGWRLPKNSGQNSFHNLVSTVYGLDEWTEENLAAVVSAPLNFTYSGYFPSPDGSSFVVYSQEESGHYWTSSGGPYNTDAYKYATWSFWPDGYDQVGYGYSVRCVAI